MSDALCGPSNPLQQFKQQTQFDRTLQQDRLASRASPSQGFRSANQNAGLLDPEFEAFQAGLPTPDPPQFNHLQRPPQFAAPSAQPSWATDFQQMHISPPPTFQQQHVPQAGPASPGWAQGFRQHITQTTPKAQQSARSPQAFQHMARYGMNGYQNHFTQPIITPNFQSKGKEAVKEQWDDDAFERIFDQVQGALVAEEEAMDVETYAAEATSVPYQRGASTGNASYIYEDQRLSQDEDLHHMESFPRHDVLQRLESDPVAEDMLREQPDSAMHASDSEVEQEKQQHDDDALAMTAQELLEKVEHNKSDKFRNSQFLSLMRKLRDREMKVEGNDMVETNAAASATTETTTSDAPVFNNSEQTPHAISDPVDWAPPDSSTQVIPPHEQDHDAGRFDPRDGQAVVDLLNQPLDASPDDIGTFAAVRNAPPARDLPQGVFYGDLRPRKGLDAPLPPSVELAYGVGGRGLDAALAHSVDWKRWDLQSPGYRSHRSAQPAPGLH